MIGVIPKHSQLRVVEEFFQLFKTPWEFFHEGRSYDVVVATSNEIGEVDARLLLIYGPDIKNTDAQAKISISSKLPNASFEYQETRAPIFGETLTFKASPGSEPCVTTDSDIVALKLFSRGKTVLRIGYDLFREAEFLLTKGQPIEYALVPTLDIHVRMLRNWILEAGIALVEIPPTPAGHALTVCLTHDIDFLGIRNHKFDHTMLGFLYRATLGAFSNFVQGRSSLSRLLKSWRAVLTLPLVYLGWANDFWLQFDWYLRVEKDLPITYFMIPFKNRAGDRLSAGHPKRRAVTYDIADIPKWTAILIREGCEIGVHGIDAWHSIEKGREELKRIADVSGESKIGVRMHWLLNDANSVHALEMAGFHYDSTSGYNEGIGYRCGTAQVFRPLGAQKLLELPIHIQDGALFFPQRLGLSEAEAWKRCEVLLNRSLDVGGILTIIWHDRSPGPERFWGDFYLRLVRELKARNVWFGTALQAVNWFGKRREVAFERVDGVAGTIGVKLHYGGEAIAPPLALRLFPPLVGKDERQRSDVVTRPFIEVSWSGDADLKFSQSLESITD